MKQNIFSKKNQLDEMQEQTLRKIESRGFWLMWWGLFVVMIFQLMMQADIGQMAGEWIVFMAACLYTLEECLRNGIWDRHIKASLSTSIVGSLVGGVLSAVVMMFATHSLAVAGVTWAANGICEWITGGDDIGETVANGVCDGFSAAKNWLGNVVNGVSSLWSKGMLLFG